MPQYVIEQIYELTKGDAIITTDVGQNQMWAAQFFKYTKPRTFISSGGLGTMGFGLPSAIGAQFGQPKSTVVSINGDGGSQMNFQELVVAVEHNLPVKMVILNNTHLGMVRQWQELFYRRDYSATVLGQNDRPKNEKIKSPKEPVYLPDFIKLAEAHGAMAIRASKQKEVIPALEKAFAEPGPVVVEVMVEKEANVYPMIPAGTSVTEMIKSSS
jgi:acetolactate synthase-1/2/3 large subunit